MHNHCDNRQSHASRSSTRPFFAKNVPVSGRDPFFTRVSAAAAPVVQAKCAACETENQQADHPAEDTLSLKSLPPPSSDEAVPDEEAEEGIQASLRIGKPDDLYEREADAVADKVVQRIPVPVPTPMKAPAPQRKCASCSRAVESSSTISHQLDAGRQGGHPIPAALRREMEGAFATDFSRVRLHDDGNAQAMNRQLHARAFTHGADIFFNTGELRSGSREGKHLLAHELTHVLQQKSARKTAIQRTCGATAIGAPAGCTPGRPEFLEHYPRYRFDSNCDTLAGGEASRLVSETAALPPSARFEIHGFASTPGDVTDNENLSCARALKARDVMTGAAPTGAGIAVGRILGVYKHGETPGPTAQRQSVVISPPLPAPLPATTPAAGVTDFQITRIGRSNPSRIFFAQGSHSLTSGATTQIAAIKSATPSSVRLIGYISADESPALAQDRADEVQSALTSAPDAVTVSSATGNPGAMQSRSDFVSARSVEVLVGSAAPATLDCSAVDALGNPVNPPTQPCPTMDPPTWTAFNSTLPVARDAMDKAVNAVTGTPSADDARLIDRFFANHSAGTLTTLRTNLGRLKAHVDNLAAITRCGGQCDIGGCESGPIAYNNGVDSGSTMTLCVPTFKNLNNNDRARNLIHESAHGTSPLGGSTAPTRGTRDVAYRHERMLFHLSPADRLRNSDSYALFAMFVREARITGNPHAIPAGIATPATDALTGFSTTGVNPEQPAVELALARLEKRLTWARSWTGQLYGQVRNVRAGTTTWTASWARNLMTEAAARFPLTAPPATPTLSDQNRVAAIIDRFGRIKQAVKRNLNVSRMASGVVSWPVSGAWIAGDTLQIGPDFFRATPEDQVSLLLEQLARATRDVESAFVPAYVSLARWIHEQNP